MAAAPLFSSDEVKDQKPKVSLAAGDIFDQLAPDPPKTTTKDTTSAPPSGFGLDPQSTAEDYLNKPQSSVIVVSQSRTLVNDTSVSGSKTL